MDLSVAIVGSGFSGIGLAIRLREQGVEDFAVLERGDGVGGTWHYNTYPGCGCDVPSNLYSFSFAPNPDWSRTYSKQPEIRAYLERTVEQFGVREKIRLGCEVRGADWDDAAQRWVIDTSQGEVRAKVLISGTGPLVEPKIPELPGLATLRRPGLSLRPLGPLRRPARQARRVDRHRRLGDPVRAVDRARRRAAARVPAHAAVGHAAQRAPGHALRETALPHRSRGAAGGARRDLRRARAARARLRQAAEGHGAGGEDRHQAPRALAARKPELLEPTTPHYTVGCKRILPSNDWYPALARENVELVTEGVAEVRERSIVTTGGRELEVDALIFGTGFHVVDMPVGRLVRGRDGRTLEDVWEGSPRAHLGSTVPGFPNFFIMLGPNTGLGHNSMIYMIESQIAYVMDALRVMRTQGAATVEVRPEIEARDHEEIQRRMQGTVWNTGCTSWYQDAKGNNPTLWPDWTWRFRRRTAPSTPRST